MLSIKNQLLLKTLNDRVTKLEADVTRLILNSEFRSEPKQEKRGPGRPKKDESQAA